LNSEYSITVANIFIYLLLLIAFHNWLNEQAKLGAAVSVAKTGIDVIITKCCSSSAKAAMVSSSSSSSGEIISKDTASNNNNNNNNERDSTVIRRYQR
jgi:hypothetical protein